MSRGDSVAHPLFLTHARQVTHSKGNQPGFPFQFQYFQGQPGAYHKTNANMEWNNTYINGDVGIPQIHRERSIISPYQSMVPDLPFSPKIQNQISSTRALFGFGLIGLAAVFLI